MVEKVISRQRRWQLRQFEKGLCVTCNRKAYPGQVRCRKHRAIARLHRVPKKV